MTDLTKNQIRFLRVKNSPKNDAYGVAGRDVVWSTDGHDMFMVGDRSGDLSRADRLYMGALLQYVAPIDGDLAGVKDPTAVARGDGYPVLASTVGNWASAARNTIVAASRLEGAELRVLCPPSAATVLLSFFGRGYSDAVTVQFDAAFVRPAASAQCRELRPGVIRKIFRFMRVARIRVVGVSDRDPIYFYGTIDGVDALAVVSPVK